MKKEEIEQLELIVKKGDKSCYGLKCESCALKEFCSENTNEFIVDKSKELLEEHEMLKALDKANKSIAAKTTEEKQEILKGLDNILHAITYHEKCYYGWSTMETEQSKHKQVIHTKCIVRWQERFNKLKEQL